MASAKLMQKASRWGQPLKNIVYDYVEVSKDILTEFRDNPVKAVLVLSIGGTLIAFLKKCPDYSDYKREVMEYSNEMGMCAETTRNHQTKIYVDRIASMMSNSSIQYLNLGVCSLIIQKQCSYNCRNYHEVCKHLQPRKWTLFRRIIDIGVWNQWLILTRTMVDFDVNDSEFN
jgi:hypothetical protein